MDFASKTCGCPVIVTEDWDLVERELGDTVYFTSRLLMFFHIPILKTRAEAKALAALRAAGLNQAESGEILTRDGLFAGKLLVAVAEGSIGISARTVSLKGTRVISKVVSGTRKDLSAGVSELLSYVRTKAGTHPKSVYFWNIDCLRCGEENVFKTVIFAEI